MSSRTRNTKKTKQQNDLSQYYGEGMIEEEPEGGEKVETRPRQRGNVLDDEEQEDEVQDYNIDTDRNQINKENMDKVSDILVSMIFKNKVNSKNAFDVPLPDVQQLTDFNQATGDTSWKKLSQTLDAGAKIYGFRVDSVHNETYKVLGGLNRTELDREEIQESQRRDDEDQDAGTQDQHARKHKRDMEGENTLEKNLHNIDANKYDLEFDIDPLFQKTSAKFDEGGAKGLLLNNLTINDQLYLMFDSGNVIDLNESDSQQQKKAPLTAAIFKDIKLGMDIFKSRLCPQLTTFKQTYLKDSKDFGPEALKSDKILSQLRNEEREASLKLEDIGDIDAEGLLRDLGEARDGELNDPQFLEQFQFHDDDAHFVGTQRTEENMMVSQKIIDHKEGEGDGGADGLNFNNIEDKLAELGDGTDSANWMGPDAWKVKLEKQKKTKDGDKRQKREPKTKKKEQIPVDFNMSVKENWKDVFGIISTTRRKDKKSPTKMIAEPEVKQAHLLPIDMQIKPVRLANLFSRGLHQGRGGYIEKAGSTKEDYDFGNNTIDNIPLEQIDPDTQDEIKLNLSKIFEEPNKEGETKFDRPERFINIKVLKEKMWSFLSDKLPTISSKDENYDDAEVMEEEDTKNKKKQAKNKKKQRDPDEPLTFSEVCKELPNFIDDQKTANISVHSCFVTILHLANEKDLRFKKEPTDFRIYREASS